MAKTLKQQATEQIVARLANEGARILRQCVEQRDYTHRTYNLYDSYGYGVYVNGKLKAYSFLGTQKATEPRKWYGENVRGREEVFFGEMLRFGTGISDAFFLRGLSGDIVEAKEIVPGAGIID